LATVGVLALQGAFERHIDTIQSLGHTARAVKLPADLQGLDSLILPGGESTTMSLLLGANGLIEPIRQLIARGLPVFGTCAGMILLAETVLDGRSDQVQLAALPITVRRNGYGRQVASFEADLLIEGEDEPFRAVFIRAPKVEAVGEGVDVLARVDSDPVLVRMGSMLAAAFHPELTDDLRLHRLFLQMVHPEPSQTKQ
jgi:5'-phosphate synthase pdxT subunit